MSTSGTIPVIVKNLEKEGLIKKCNDERDKRRFILHITEKGKNLMKEVYPENEAIIVSKMGIWTKSQQEELVKLMKKFGGIQDEENGKR